MIFIFLARESLDSAQFHLKVIYIIKWRQGWCFVPDTLISLIANYSGFHTSSQADSLCLLCVVSAWWWRRSKKAVTTWQFSTLVPFSLWIKVTPTCLWIAIERVSPKTEHDILMTSGAASHGPVCCNWTRPTGSDCGLEKELPAMVGRSGSRLPLALGEGAELEQGSEDKL